MASKTSEQATIEHRAARRLRVDEPATVKHARTVEKALVRDISVTGAQIVLDRPPEPDTPIEIKIEAVGTVKAKVRWRNGSKAGASFEDVTPETAAKIKRL